MRLPNADRAVVEARKVREYLLAFDHPIGRAKARFFRRELEGDFRIVEVDTVNGRVTEVDLVRLSVPDSVAQAGFTKPRTRIRRGSAAPDSRLLPIPKLVGAARVAPNGPLEPNWALYANGNFGSGCPDSMVCLDHSPTVYSATHYSDTGFFGEWSNPMIGIVRLYDLKTKRTLPPPSGYFCAIRRDDA